MALRFFPFLLTFLVGAGSTIWCLLASPELSATFDEPVYLKCGLDCWRNHTHKPLMRLGTMPLPVDWATLPLYVEEQFRDHPFNPEVEFETMLGIARGFALVFWWNLLVQVARLGWRVGGGWCGFWMVALVALEPNLLGHACLATTDIAVTGFLVGTLNAYLNLKDDPRSGFRKFVLVVWWGLALFAKASSLVFVPLILISVEVARLFPLWLQGRDKRELFADFLSCFFSQIRLGLWAFALVFLLCGSDWTTEVTFVKWAQGLEEGPFKSIMVFLSENLRIFTNAGEGFAQQIKHNMRGHPSYLLGQGHEKAVLYHFPVLLLIKLPTTFFLLLPLILWEQWKRTWWFGLVVCLAFLAFSLNCRVQIGVRLIFPLLVFLACLAGHSIHLFLARWGKPVQLGLGVILLGILSGQAWRQFPDGIRYINDFWGQGQGWPGLVSDSNYDWGQGLVELSRHPWAQGQKPLFVLYWGGEDPRVSRDPLFRLRPETLDLNSEAAVENWLQGKKIAVGATILYGPPLGSPPWETFRRVLQKKKPAGVTRTFFLFDLEIPPKTANSPSPG